MATPDDGDQAAGGPCPICGQEPDELFAVAYRSFARRYHADGHWLGRFARWLAVRDARAVVRRHDRRHDGGKASAVEGRLVISGIVHVR